MPLLEKPAGKANTGIRSLSAPTLNVRKNRTSHLRSIFSVHNADLSYLARPPMGETNPTVAGQNKSTAKMNQKQINLWFRDKRYMVDKLQRYEDEVYERLVAIEKTKWQIQRSRENSPDRMESASRNNKTNLPRIDTQFNKSLIASLTPDKVDDNTEKKENQEETKNENESKEKNKDNQQDVKSKEENSSSNINPEEKNEKKEEKPSIKITLADEPAENSVPMTVSAKQVPPARPLTQQHSPITPRPEMTPRAATNGEGMLDSARKLNDIDTDEKPKIPRPKTIGTFAQGNTGSKNQLNRMTKSDSKVSVGSTESMSKARKIELKILNEPFTFWKKNAQGALVEAEVPYKRRGFPLPIESHDEERRQKFLETERKSKRDHNKKFKSLCDNLESLEKFNPLAEMLELRRLEAERIKEEFDAQEKWKKLGMLRHWVKAIQVREQRDLEGLDPNSEEALRQCKYLRVKEKKGSGPLTPKEEKEVMKKKYKNTLLKRITKATSSSSGQKPAASSLVKT